MIITAKRAAEICREWYFAFRNMEKGEMPKWISVEERLPKQYVSVLVYMPDEYPRPTVHEGYLMPDGIWDAAHYLRNPDDVTYWMPLPDAPKDKA